MEEKPSKRRKFALVEQGWGTKTTILGARNMNNIEKESEIMGEEQEATETRKQEDEIRTVTLTPGEDNHPDHPDPPQSHPH